MAVQGGYDCSFVAEPARSYDCPVCLLVLRAPHLVDCCGHHFCRGCIGALRDGGRPCPLCSSASFSTMRNLEKEREILDLLVWCPHRCDLGGGHGGGARETVDTVEVAGCSWSGELKRLDDHVGRDCLAVVVSCAWGCGAEFPRGKLPQHRDVCSKRPWYLRLDDESLASLGERLETLATENLSLGSDMAALSGELREVKRENGSLKETVEELRELARSASVERAVFSAQLESLRLRLDSFPSGPLTRNRSSTTDLEESSPLARERDEPCPTTTPFDSLPVASTPPADYVDVVATPTNTASAGPSSTASPGPSSTVPVFFTMTNFKQRKRLGTEWNSPPFYSHEHGYKLSLRVDAAGSLAGKGSHVSLYFYVLRGEHDDDLRWPLEGTFVVRLLNQSTDSAHFEKSVAFVASLPGDISGRVMVGDRAARGHGFPCFVGHMDLGYDEAWGRQLLQDDCLRFCVAAFKLRPSSKAGKGEVFPPTRLFKWLSRSGSGPGT